MKRLMAVLGLREYVFRIVFGLVLTSWSLTGCGSSGPPFPPEEASEAFEIEPGFQIELFASEPDVADPVAMEFDESGQIYVVENSGYPLETEGAVGKVKLLVDTDEDGRPDRSTVFVDGLTMPTGVMAWKQGILVTDPPHVLYFEDRDGDGRADLRKTVLTGFAFTNPQHTVSSPMYGLDNWIYLSHEGYTRAVVFSDKFGDTGDVIHYPDRPDGPQLEVERRSVRFRPDLFQLEYLAGPSQFGQTFDRWGRLFTHNNSNHVRHEVLAARYWERNPLLPLDRPWQDMPDHGNAAEVYPITLQPRFEILSGAGQITSACGLTLYLGGEFPPGFENVSFVAEPVHNLVHVDVWEPQGATFVAKRMHERKEFLASTDRWFRPVNFYIGPDGALYLLDYYREVIEHPEWTSAEVYESGEIYEGNQHGRIYRIVPEGGLPFATNVELGEASSEELVKHLAHRNIWWRRTAQRLLVDRADRNATPHLEQMVRESTSPEGRVHALWTLQGLGQLHPSTIAQALTDAEPGVRENALILSENFLESDTELRQQVLAMADDPEPRVRFQWLATAGFLDSAKALALRDKLLFANTEDVWMQTAALSWPSADALELYEKAVVRLDKKQTEASQGLVRRLAAMIGVKGHPGEITRLLTRVNMNTSQQAWWRVATLEGLVQSWKTHAAESQDTSQQNLLVDLAADPEPRIRRAALELLGTLTVQSNQALRSAVHKAEEIAADPGIDSERRADALRLLAVSNPESHRDLLQKLIDPRTPETVQAAAAEALGKIKGIEPVRFLLETWRSLPGKARQTAADAFYESEERTALLVEALEREEIQPWMLNSRQRSRLIMHKNPELRRRGRALLTKPEPDRHAVLEKYRAALEMEADTERGREVFERACAKCHMLNGEGKEVGPDLATIRSRPGSLILEDILLPNRSIAQTYEAYVIETADGRTIDGVIGPQGPGFVTLRRENGEKDVVQRKNIKRMYASNLSAMPDDLENQLSLQDMADLLLYIKTPE